MDALIRNVETLVETMQDCLQRRRLLPCLCLLYTGMDVLASLESSAGEGTRQAFARWVDRYVVQGHGVPCTALELYGARCGVLHTFTPDSDLARRGQVRQLYYAWGNRRPEALQHAVDAVARPVVAVHLDQLVDAFRTGVADYFAELAADPARQQAIAPRASLWFNTPPPGLIEAFNALHGDDSAS